MTLIEVRGHKESSQHCSLGLIPDLFNSGERAEFDYACMHFPLFLTVVDWMKLPG